MTDDRKNPSSYLNALSEQRNPKVLFEEVCRLYEDLEMQRDMNNHKNKRMEEYAKKAFEAMNERDTALARVVELEKALGGGQPK